MLTRNLRSKTLPLATQTSKLRKTTSKPGKPGKTWKTRGSLLVPINPFFGANLHLMTEMNLQKRLGQVRALDLVQQPSDNRYQCYAQGNPRGV